MVIAASPSDSIYKGMVAYLFCCVNIDPRGFIPEDGVVFIQNGTRRREPTSTPYENFSSDIDTLFSVRGPPLPPSQTQRVGAHPLVHHEGMEIGNVLIGQRPIGLDRSRQGGASQNDLFRNFIHISIFTLDKLFYHLSNKTFSASSYPLKYSITF